ncbi:MAG: YlbF family regulator [Chloroflexi bacterium]|nr:YlbF family regulator [Chloroflexota bacterium]
MLSTTLHEAAVAFGLALRQAPVVAAFRASADALEHDPIAQGLLEDLRIRQLELNRLQQSGLTASPQQLASLRLCQDAVRANSTIMAYLRATNDVKAFLPTVATQVSATLGVDYASLMPASC